jgi:predicted 2-oxoglutarate/Fe(II)-dependent dioxygenase YbiX
MSSFINGFFTGEIVPDAVVGGCIEIFENAWPNPQETIAMVEDQAATPNAGAYWQKAETFGAGAYQNIRTNKLMAISHLGRISDNAALQNVHNQYNLMLLAASIPYAVRYGIEGSLFHEDYSLLKYGEGEEYKQHFDGLTHSGRAISAICYLNDDYEGGELEFPHFGVKLKPQAGMLLLFPSNFAYAHIAHPVTKGTKYALVTWLKDRQLS